MTFPYFDPADFATVSPSASFASASTSSSTASAPWVDASSSPYSSSSAIALQASSSQSSLWTVSSASDNEEQRCLDLLDQLEAEVTKLGGDGQKARKRASRIVGGRIAFPVEQGDVFGELGGLGAQAFLTAASEAAAYRDLHSTRSTATLRPAHSYASSPRSRRSRRLSFTQTDLADLDIDAILDAYGEDGLLPSISLDGPPGRPHRSPLRGAKSHAQFGGYDAYERPGTAHSSHSLPMSRNPTDELFPHRRVAPFPTIQRKKSVASVRSNPRARAPSDAPPPLPHLPPTPQYASSPSGRSHRTFTSFARQSTYSNSSSGSYTPSSPNASARSVAMRGSLSRDSQYSNSSATSASSYSGNSFRWSVATSSTAPSTEYSDNCSRRGSASGSSPACVGISSPTSRSTATMGRSPRFVAPVEESEDEQAQHDLPVSRRRPSHAQLRARQRHQADDEAHQRTDKGGLISWEDFATELDALPPPPPLSRQFLPSAPARPAPQPASIQQPSTYFYAEQQELAAKQKKAHRMRKISLATLRIK
ncbi:hypothetical protein NBRC10512_001092 [Rhodotorula toruloides]|uniref:RHTO0S06e11232g1_1 n=2 Tax=Rhodotorula toruloides TaxID=5286 RepID=A0A061AYB2_RHOTO|nr:uncharacterized protein RHTO_04387 [Rhodotorula toruloides NP11]EMS19386.1 hypothetical protein RHTO_04387 [Rhodotorula toruloides NP11]CDR42230.1 RHTO0S06e11232g1_1 [Rhodotorula toruloides]